MSSLNIGQFDSASTTVRVLAAAINGQGTVGLAMPKMFDLAARASQYLPSALRTRLFSFGAANEAVQLSELSSEDGPRAARWVTSRYENVQKTRSIFIGATNGAVVDLAARLGAPWLPQTWLVLLRREVDPDDISAVIEHGTQISDRLIKYFPDVAIHQMHDPLNDRGNAAQAAYLRMKWQRLPDAYRDFIRTRLEPGGTIFINGCDYRWPTKKLGEHHFFQLGGYGAIASEDLLARYGYSANACWSQRPEAEWGYEEALTADVQELAASVGARVVRLTYEAPQALSAPIARLFMKDSSQRLFVTNFNMLAPAFIGYSGAVPYWAVFNDQKSLADLQNFLKEHGPFEGIESLLFQNGVNADGQATALEWRNVLAAHTPDARLVGLRPAHHPQDFAAFDRYRRALRDIEHNLQTPKRRTLVADEVQGWFVQQEGIGRVL